MFGFILGDDNTSEEGLGAPDIVGSFGDERLGEGHNELLSSCVLVAYL